MLGNPRTCSPTARNAVRRNLAQLLLAGLLVATGCRRERVFTEMSDSAYVRTMVALRKLPIGSGNPTVRARQRDSILNAFGVTAAQLESVAVRLADDPERAAEIFRAIENAGAISPP